MVVNLLRNLLTGIGIFLCENMTMLIWCTWFYVTDFAERMGTAFKSVDRSPHFVVLHSFLTMAVNTCVVFNFQIVEMFFFLGD